MGENICIKNPNKWLIFEIYKAFMKFNKTNLKIP